MSEPTVPPPPSYTPPPPPPPSSGGPAGPGHVSPNRSVMLVLSYLGLLALIPLLVEKDDPEVQWHAKHGLVLTVLWIILGFGLGLLSGMLAFADLGCSGCIAQWILSVVILVVHIMAIIKALNGQRLIIPGISDFANRF